MSQGPKTTLKALHAYHSRGRDALDLLRKGQVDDANEVLLLRKAAFHNFRVAEVLGDESSLFDQDEYQQLWKKCEVLDRELETAMSREIERLKSELSRVRYGKAGLGSCHSGERVMGRFRSPA